MNERERMTALEAENQQLKSDNDQLLEIIVQMRMTLNRLIDRYVVEN